VIRGGLGGITVARGCCAELFCPATTSMVPVTNLTNLCMVTGKA
jgi:hypothetical protein